MSSRRSHSGNVQNNKDKERAAYMKKLGTKRVQARCPICNKVVAANKLYQHIILHK